MNRQNQKIYKNSFSLFLKSTNEKKVILEFVKKNISLGKVKDVLDIGGGNGALALPLALLKKNVTVVEPNKQLAGKLNSRRIKYVNKTWENYKSSKKFDLVVAAYVVTYFKKKDLPKLIDKMYELVLPGGCLIIFTIDPKRGSWRGIHTYFYQLLGIEHKSSTYLLKSYLSKYKHVCSRSIKTLVKTKNISEMLKILAFDFYQYEPNFTKYKIELEKYLKKHLVGKSVILKMVHEVFIIKK